MTEKDRRDWLATRDKLIQILRDTVQLLIDYPPENNDADFQFLANKAAKLRDWIVEIERILRED
ncbi:MAG: hypothetical protein LH606_11475 [Cytophagaceae bacterium]|nr:hypothetical protein [Cytophagaceae bacterium]